MTPADERVLELLQKWQKSLELHAHYAGLPEDQRVELWESHNAAALIGLRCRTCSRHVLLERRALESRFAGFVERGDPAISAAARPAAARPGPTSAA